MSASGGGAEVRRSVKLVTVHGTGAGHKEDSGDLWWQTRSPFQQELAKRLHLDRADVEIVPFHWELGPNSESGRRAAGAALYKLLKGYDRSGENYYLIGHSHGGSVIHSALLHSVAKGKPFERLKSWCTIGTPFLDYRPSRLLLSRLGGMGLTVYATAIGALLLACGFLADYFFGSTPNSKFVKAELGEVAFYEYFAPNIILYGAYGIACLTLLYGAARIRGGWHTQRQKRRVADLYADRWLGLWHRDDEALSALSNVRFVKAPIIPSNFLVPVIAFAPVLVTVLAVVWVGYSSLLSREDPSPQTIETIRILKSRANSARPQTVSEALKEDFVTVLAVLWRTMPDNLKEEWLKDEEFRNLKEHFGLQLRDRKGTAIVHENGPTGTPGGASWLPKQAEIGRHSFYIALVAVVVAIYLALTAVVVLAFKLLARWVGWPLAKAIDRLVWSTVRQQAWGADRRGEFVGQIGSHPAEFDERFRPLPDAIGNKLSQYSEKHAILTLAKVREVLE